VSEQRVGVTPCFECKSALTDLQSRSSLLLGFQHHPEDGSLVYKHLELPSENTTIGRKTLASGARVPAQKGSLEFVRHSKLHDEAVAFEESAASRRPT